jgi:hypothetical protein
MRIVGLKGVSDWGSTRTNVRLRRTGVRGGFLFEIFAGRADLRVRPVVSRDAWHGG